MTQKSLLHAVAAQIANGYETAEVPMYSEQLRMPDRKVIIKIIENLQKVFFPAYFAGGTVSHVSAETFAEFLLGEIYTDLCEQVHLAFSNTIKDETELRERTSAVCDRFLCRLPQIQAMLMKDVANAIAANHPEAYLMMLLIDERPEEVTDMARTVNAEVIASTFDEPAERHVKIAGLVLEKAKRMVECGHDVVIFLDSITRLARAYNTVAPASGKVLTGGVDANALQKPKRFFGAARNIEGGGSLTIIATALIDTGSKMDEVIFEEFKGTGNMELQLDRSLSNKRMFPAVNLVASSTRRDDLLQDDTTVNRMRILRQYIGDMTSIEAMNTIHDRMIKTRDNEEFLMSMNE